MIPVSDQRTHLVLLLLLQTWLLGLLVLLRLLLLPGAITPPLRLHLLIYHLITLHLHPTHHLITLHLQRMRSYSSMDMVWNGTVVLCGTVCDIVWWYGMLVWRDILYRKNRAFCGSGQTSRVGSGRVESADTTREKIEVCWIDPTRPDPRDFESLLTRPDATRET